MGSFSNLRSGFLCTIPILLVFTLPHLGVSIDMDSANEGPCFEVTNTTELDINWIYSVKQWYLPLMSRSELYHGAVILLQKDPNDIPENHVYYNNCGIWEMDQKSAAYSGFGGKRVNLKVSSNGLKRFDFRRADSDEEIATCYATLCDDKSFCAYVCCYTDNQMTWGVASVEKTLPEETVTQILTHVEELGFKKKQFTGVRYDSCLEEKNLNLEFFPLYPYISYLGPYVYYY